MANRISGPGLGLPVPARLYPATLLNGAPNPENTNSMALGAGDTMPVPSGEWLIGLGPYTIVQELDPITGTWRNITGGNIAPGGLEYVRSDGFNLRVANLTGCVIGAVITGSSAGWVQGTTTISANLGGSTWQAVVGGALSTTISISTVGAGFGIAPIVIAPAPASPGIPSNIVATIGSGTVSGMTMIDQGAGYSGSTVTLTVIPNPSDPNLAAGLGITLATAVTATTGSGSLTGALCTNSGAPLTAVPTITATGAGTATLAPLWLVCASSLSITAGGSQYSTTVGLSSFGGAPLATDILKNPTFDLTGFTPRALQAIATVTSAGGTIATGAPFLTIDKGLFLVTAAKDSPIGFFETAGATPGTIATLAITLGSTSDVVMLNQI